MFMCFAQMRNEFWTETVLFLQGKPRIALQEKLGAANYQYFTSYGSYVSQVRAGDRDQGLSHVSNTLLASQAQVAKSELVNRTVLAIDFRSYGLS